MSFAKYNAEMDLYFNLYNAKSVFLSICRANISSRLYTVVPILILVLQLLLYLEFSYFLIVYFNDKN